MYRGTEKLQCQAYSKSCYTIEHRLFSVFTYIIYIYIYILYILFLYIYTVYIYIIYITFQGAFSGMTCQASLGACAAMVWRKR